jgi:hypothetical protein
MPRRNSRRLALRPTMFRRVFVVGRCGRGTGGLRHLNFTQEYLAEMLGVGRTSVTVVAQAAGLIKYARGKIHIVDAEALQDEPVSATKR